MPRENHRIGRNDPCPCGSGKKFKRCCSEMDARELTPAGDWQVQQDAWARLARKFTGFATRTCPHEIPAAWQDFNLRDDPEPFDPNSDEQQIFMPYFLFHWDPRRPLRGKRAAERGSLVMSLYRPAPGELSDVDRALLDQAMSQPFSFHEVLWSRPGEGLGLRDVLLGDETEVIERQGSRTLQKGDLIYAQSWNVRGVRTLGGMAPLCIPPRGKGDIVTLRAKLRRKIAKQNRALHPDDLFRYADHVRLAYLEIRDGLRQPPRFSNTDGDPLVFHTLKFRIQSPEEAFEHLAPLAFGRSKEELRRHAQFDSDGKLSVVSFDWLKKGNKKHPTWDNTILGKINISGRSLVAEVNSEARAARLRAEIEKRLGPSAIHQGTTARTVHELLASTPKRGSASRAGESDGFMRKLLQDPEARGHLRDDIQRDVNSWVTQKIPALRGRTPAEAVKDPDGKEIVESILLDWERHAASRAYLPGLAPDINAIRKLLNLDPPDPSPGS